MTGTYGAYVDFVDLALGRRAAGDFTDSGTYDGGSVSRLWELKTVGDPSNAFQLQRSIPRLDGPPPATTGRRGQMIAEAATTVHPLRKGVPHDL